MVLQFCHTAPSHPPLRHPSHLRLPAVQVLADSRGQPAFGTSSKAAALLQQFIKGQA